MPNIALPTQLDFLRWASQLRLDLSDFYVPIVNSQEEWRQWASQLILQNPSFKNMPLPTENSYPSSNDWRRWAAAFTQIIQQQ